MIITVKIGKPNTNLLQTDFFNSNWLGQLILQQNDARMRC